MKLKDTFSYNSSLYMYVVHVQDIVGDSNKYFIIIFVEKLKIKITNKIP